VGVFDPIALLTRSLGLGIAPVYNAAGQDTLDALYGIFGNEGPPRWLDALSTFSSAKLFAHIRPVYYQGPFIALLLVLIVALCRQRFRFWCRYVCPIGVTYAVVGVASPVRVTYNAEACHHEGDCRKICEVPHVLDLTIRGAAHDINQDVSSDCTRCGTCVDVCPTESLNFKVKGLDMFR